MLDEKIGFVTRELLRTMRDEHIDLESAFGRLNQHLSTDMRRISERMREGLVAGRTEAEYDWLRVAVRSIQLARDHGGTIDAAVWTDLETYSTENRGLSSTLSQTLVRTSFLSVATIGVAIVVGLIYVIFVLPQFDTLFESLGTELPLLTQFVLVGLRPLIFLLPLIAILASIFLLPVRPTWKAGQRVWQLAPLNKRVRIGSEFVLRYRQQLFIAFASTLTRFGVPPRTALQLASRETQLYADNDFAANPSPGQGDSLLTALVGADRAGHLHEEIIAQRAIRAEALLLAAERLQFEFSFVVRAGVYALVGLMLVAMYLPIFKLGAAV